MDCVCYVTHLFIKLISSLHRKYLNDWLDSESCIIYCIFGIIVFIEVFLSKCHKWVVNAGLYLAI